jgi:hypothetical protein
VSDEAWAVAWRQLESASGPWAPRTFVGGTAVSPGASVASLAAGHVAAQSTALRALSAALPPVGAFVSFYSSEDRAAVTARDRAYAALLADHGAGLRAWTARFQTLWAAAEQWEREWAELASALRARAEDLMGAPPPPPPPPPPTPPASAETGKGGEAGGKDGSSRGTGAAGRASPGPARTGSSRA